MERERPSQKWTSAVADPVNNFMETLERERGAKKAFSSEVIDSIIAELKENIQFKEKNQKSLKQKRKKPNWWSKSKRFLDELCNMESKV